MKYVLGWMVNPLLRHNKLLKSLFPKDPFVCPKRRD